MCIHLFISKKDISKPSSHISELPMRFVGLTEADSELLKEVLCCKGVADV